MSVAVGDEIIFSKYGGSGRQSRSGPKQRPGYKIRREGSLTDLPVATAIPPSPRSETPRGATSQPLTSTLGDRTLPGRQHLVVREQRRVADAALTRSYALD
jgi:hypothetical protein